MYEHVMANVHAAGANNRATFAKTNISEIYKHVAAKVHAAGANTF